MSANVGLILEGTYPYVSGGVSACVHQLIEQQPKTTFELIFLGIKSSEILVPKYHLPANVVGVQELFLFDEFDASPRRNRELPKSQAIALNTIHREVHRGEFDFSDLSSPEEIARAFERVGQEGDFGERLFQSLGSRALWELLVREYERADVRLPFIEFFYSWRSAHLPLYRVLTAAYPKAEVYHSLCTGYAGIAGVVASLQHEGSFILTEHGIYAHERSIEISEADWLQSRNPLSNSLATDVIKQWWVDMFRNFSRIAYLFADDIITLYEGNRAKQISHGARREKTQIIPNGISPKFRDLRAAHPDWSGEKGKPFTIGFIGRVVPIKDVKTLVKSLCNVVARFPHVKCRVVGPVDEDPEYYRQCLELVDVLNLSHLIEFEGKRNVLEVYPDLDCVLLTSISEAQPLVILEANAAGIPVVATRVGGCEELIHGGSEADRRLGPSGLTSPIRDPESIAQCICRLIESPELWKQLALAGRERARVFYDETALVGRYQRLYAEHRAGMRSRAPLEGVG